ncbi:unnamed protein product [Staurois parvus]|uniref:Uncharacterized protein n=1 Tax=Staurois parvus TaxID=386267 RepID=A0ABN9BFR5_9NEOB|nr:unnamed protein product [Staurois parvus]
MGLPRSRFCHGVPEGPPIAAARPLICHGPYIPPPHAAARSKSLMGPCNGLPLLLSPSPHSAMCPLSGLLTHCWCEEFFDIGCWQITGLPLAAARPLICHGPLYNRLLMLLPGPMSLMGPCNASPLLLSPSPHSAMCQFQVTSHIGV